MPERSRAQLSIAGLMFAVVTLQPLWPDFNGDVGIMCAAWAGRNSRTTYLNIVTLDLSNHQKSVS